MEEIMKITSADAFALARVFRELSVALGDYRFTKWEELKPAQKRFIEDAEWTLLNASSDMITTAIGLVLDESEMSFDALEKAAEKARQTVRELAGVRKVIKVAAAAIGLAGAIVSKEPLAVFKNARALLAASSAA
jgi:hypothetical protein